MSKNETEGLVLVLDVGETMSTKINRTTTYLQSCVDIIQMIVQRKMFQSSKDEIGLTVFGCDQTDNELWDGSSDDFRHVSLVRCLSIVDWEMLDHVQNKIAVSNITGDVLDGILVALNHFADDQNKKKAFKEKRVIVLTDFSSCSNDDFKLKEIGKNLTRQSIRLDVISPFSEDDVNKEEKPSGETNSNSEDHHGSKQMTIAQVESLNLLNNLCEQAEGCLFSFDETLTLLSTYQARTIKSSGTKYQMTIGEKFSLPIVSMIKCKESKPEIFRFKKVYAKDENVELKTDRARFTKDDEQRDLNDKADIVDAFKYGSTYVPIDSDTVSLKLEVEKCFNVLGFTKSENVHKHYFIGDSVNQIMPDPSSGAQVEEAFVNMVRAMYEEDVFGIVRKVFNSRSSPEMGCLIPYVTKEATCLFYLSLPFDDDLKKITLDNFTSIKKFKPSEKQLSLVDDLINAMDLSRKIKIDEEEELYDPHTTFNPYIQRMFQSIALRATNPSDELPNFEDHITNTHLAKIGSRIRNNTTHNILKRFQDEFPLRELVKKAKKNEENIFEKTKIDDNKEVELMGSNDENLTDILESGLETNKIKKVGTVNPVGDFKILAEKIISTNTQEAKEEFEQICMQIQEIIKELFEESLQQANSFNDSDLNDMTVFSFQEKSFNCVKIMRQYSLKLNHYSEFNSFLKTFKIYLINESLKIKMAKYVENFWQKFFIDNNLGLISNSECNDSDVSSEAAEKFLISLNENSNNSANNKEETKEKEEVEDLLDLM